MAGSRMLSSLNFNKAIPVVLDLSFNWQVFTYAFAAALLRASSSDSSRRFELRVEI
jgi:hypothetical protein